MSESIYDLGKPLKAGLLPHHFHLEIVPILDRAASLAYLSAVDAVKTMSFQNRREKLEILMEEFEKNTIDLITEHVHKRYQMYKDIYITRLTQGDNIPSTDDNIFCIARMAKERAEQRVAAIQTISQDAD